MYIIFPILIFFMITCTVIFRFRKKRIICKIRKMCPAEKLCRLNELTEPFGFCYELCPDIFTSRPDAWQRDYGYCYLYDAGAVHLNMVFDCEPVYFDYDGRTWLIEFWKGQYGINTGCEIGIYQADKILRPKEREYAWFHTVPDALLPDFSMRLIKGTSLVFCIRRRHWWLTGFHMGQYSVPELLRMDISVTFRDPLMARAFVRGLMDTGYKAYELNVCDADVSFTFDTPKTAAPCSRCPFSRSFSLWKNRLFLWLYCHATRPFCNTMDQLLYLYESVPFAFRHMMRIHTYRSPGGRRRKP